MRTVEEHLSDCLRAVRPLPPSQVLLHDAVGCLLAEDVVAERDLPEADLAGTDGYAVGTGLLRGRDTPSDGRLRVLDEVTSGAAESGVLVAGATLMVSTGAVLPGGADAVVPLADTDGGVAQVALRRPPVAGEHVRRRGSELLAGDVLLRAGTRLGSRHLALLAATGVGRLVVQPRPRVVVLPVGSDLVEAGRRPRAGAAFDANGHALARALESTGVTAYRVAAAPDDHARLRETIEDQVVRADLVLTTGGLSAGREDTLRSVLGMLGRARFDDVALDPGGRFGIAEVGDGVPVLALPGSPVAAQVGFELFVRPVLRALAGEQAARPEPVPARSLAAFTVRAGRRQMIPVRLTGSADEGYRCEPTGDPARASLRSYAAADAIAVVPEDVTDVAVGADLECLVLAG